jgi:NhaP-type Na+/H+ or K+/H+ antiporter
LFSPSVRLQAHGFWDSLTFAMNGLVFVLIGLQLPFVLAGIRGIAFHTLLLYGVLSSSLVASSTTKCFANSNGSWTSVKPA